MTTIQSSLGVGVDTRSCLRDAAGTRPKRAQGNGSLLCVHAVKPIPRGSRTTVARDTLYAALREDYELTLSAAA